MIEVLSMLDFISFSYITYLTNYNKKYYIIIEFPYVTLCKIIKNWFVPQAILIQTSSIMSRWVCFQS